MKGYKELLGRLYKLNRGGAPKYDLERMRALCSHYGNPQGAFDCVHVTGTNGKGSVTFKLGEVLRENGLRTGVFQSPHVSSFRERVAVDGKMVEEGFVESFVEGVMRDIERGRVEGSFFEVVTLLAFAYFRECGVDIACVEVGIGGRLDATNVLSRSILAIITAVGLDHCELLGDTCEAIAYEKCGIIRRGSAALAGPTVPVDVFKKVCGDVGAEAYLMRESGESFEETNIELVREAVRILGKRGVAVPVVKEEWLGRRLKCRMEAVPRELVGGVCKDLPRAVYLDVGHNPQAMKAMLDAVEKAHPQREIWMVYGTSSKKDAHSALREARSRVGKTFLIQARSERAKSVEELSEAAKELLVEHQVVAKGDIKETLEHIFSLREIEENVVVVCGSFFIMEEARLFFGFDDPHDPFFLNEASMPTKG